MKYLLLLISVLFNSILFAQNEIDSLKSFEEVKDFVNNIRPTFNFVDLNNISIKDLDRILKKENYANQIIQAYQIDSNYYIRDFNNDGYNDLLIYGYEKGIKVLVIMNEAEGYKTHNLYLNDTGIDAIFPKVTNNTNLITLYEIETIKHDRILHQEIPVQHLLTYHDSAFVAYNPTPKEYAIDSIIISMSCPWWSYNKYSFRIDGKSTKGWINNKEEKLNLPSLSNPQWTTIKKRLNYADFPTIKLPNYVIMDNVTYITTIFYNNGLEHIIKDNNGYANRSLSLIYQEIMPLKEKMDEILKEKNKPRLPELK